MNPRSLRYGLVFGAILWVVFLMILRGMIGCAGVPDHASDLAQIQAEIDAEPDVVAAEEQQILERQREAFGYWRWAYKRRPPPLPRALTPSGP